MRRNQSYRLAFVMVVVMAALGFILAINQAHKVKLPRVTVPADLQQFIDDVDLAALLPRVTPPPTEVSRTATLAVVLTPEAEVASATATEPAPAPSETAPAVEVPTNTPAVVENRQFGLSGGVQARTDDCPAAGIFGSVRDAAGNPLAHVRLWRYDQFGNEDLVETGSSDTDRGQYQLLFEDKPNVQYVQVIDASGVLISPVVEVQHRQGDTPDALCHQVDWQSNQ